MDSVSVRVAFKYWGGELEECHGPNWNWDSLTWRLAPSDTVPHTFMMTRPEFRLGRVLAPNSAWFVVMHSGYSVQDSFRVTTGWSDAFTTPYVRDAQVWLRVRVVSPWPESPGRPMRTATLKGLVVDDSTGRGLYFSQVVVLDTRCSTYTDTLGRFILKSVPTDQVVVEACAGSQFKDMIVTVPSDTLVIRLPHPRGRTGSR
jgi:hypothetical protein